MEPTVFNLQRKRKISTGEFLNFAKGFSSMDEFMDRAFSVAFVSDKRMKDLNQLFRGKDSTTDVLSFPHEADQFDPDNNNLGDIVISVEQAELQAKQNGLTLENEIKQLMLHGLLHLCGYDHETDSGEMNGRELQLREELGI